MMLLTGISSDQTPLHPVDEEPLADATVLGSRVSWRCLPMRLSLMASAAVLAAASFSAGPVWAQPAPGRTAGLGPHDGPAVSCDNPPPEAARSIPAPFDSYMRLVCRYPLGQGLEAVEGFRWTMPGGEPIGLTATLTTGGLDADGLRRFPTSWYVELSPVDLSPVDQRRLKLDLRRAVRPRLLDRAAVLELRARTSNGEAKSILLVIPGVKPEKSAWLIGLECNGTCFREDAEPLIFAGSAG